MFDPVCLLNQFYLAAPECVRISFPLLSSVIYKARFTPDTNAHVSLCTLALQHEASIFIYQTRTTRAAMDRKWMERHLLAEVSAAAAVVGRLTCASLS